MRVESLPKLPWTQASEESVPPSNPDGNPFDVVFVNDTNHPVHLHWMDRQGGKRLYGVIDAGKSKRQQTRPGAIWAIADTTDKLIGYFTVGDRAARAVVSLD